MLIVVSQRAARSPAARPPMTTACPGRALPVFRIRSKDMIHDLDSLCPLTRSLPAQSVAMLSIS
jgi:hypothetical protein